MELKVGSQLGPTFILPPFLEHAMKTIAELLASRAEREEVVKASLSVIRKLPLSIEWKTQAQVLLFEEQTCLRCGSHCFPFLGHFIEEAKPDGSTKLSRGLAASGFPTKRRVHASTVPLCYFCLGIDGGNFDGE